MRIAITSSGLGHVQRGIEAWALALAEGLCREGQDVVLYCGSQRREAESGKREAESGKREVESGRWKLDGDKPEGQPSTSNIPHSTDGCPGAMRHAPCALRVALQYRSRFDPWVRLLARLAPPFAWRWGWRSAYAMEQKSFVRALFRSIEHHAPDIIHTQDVEVARALTQARERRQIPCRTILAHGTDEPLTELDGIEYIQHLSPFYEQEARQLLPNIRHFCIPNFVDTSRFVPAVDDIARRRMRREWRVADGKTVVGTSAALEIRHKRLDAVIREVRLLKDNGHHVHLVLAGAETEETPMVRQLAKEMLGSDCTVLTSLPFDAMPDFYRGLDVYVHPAPAEFFGICLLEAMACGVPVVAHDSPTLKWIVGPGGWNVNVAMEGFFLSPWRVVGEEGSQVGIAGRRHVQEMFSWEAVYPRFKRMYAAVGM